jgi:hypothetical protein
VRLWQSIPPGIELKVAAPLLAAASRCGDLVDAGAVGMSSIGIAW